MSEETNVEEKAKKALCRALMSLDPMLQAGDIVIQQQAAPVVADRSMMSILGQLDSGLSMSDGEEIRVDFKERHNIKSKDFTTLADLIRDTTGSHVVSDHGTYLSFLGDYKALTAIDKPEFYKRLAVLTANDRAASP